MIVSPEETKVISDEAISYLRFETYQQGYDSDTGVETLFIEYFDINLTDIQNHLNNLTKHDKGINPLNLSNKELREACYTSISKFIELHPKQPKELMHILIPYADTPIKEYVEVIKSHIQSNDEKDFEIITKVFKHYKRDLGGKLYNYDLFAFLYYFYSLFVSFEHLYNSKL